MISFIASAILDLLDIQWTVKKLLAIVMLISVIGGTNTYATGGCTNIIKFKPIAGYKPVEVELGYIITYTTNCPCVPGPFQAERNLTQSEIDNGCTEVPYQSVIHDNNGNPVAIKRTAYMVYWMDCASGDLNNPLYGSVRRPDPGFKLGTVTSEKLTSGRSKGLWQIWVNTCPTETNSTPSLNFIKMGEWSTCDTLIGGGGR